MAADLQSRKKWEIAIAQIVDALEWGVRRHPVLADAGYGNSPEFRAALERLGLPYVVAVSGNHTVYPRHGTVSAAPKNDWEAASAAS